MKKILILGAMSTHIPIIERAEEIGFFYCGNKRHLIGLPGKHF